LQNSDITCRQTPHGAGAVISPFFPPTMAIFTKSRFPSLTALKKAVLSAQFVGVNAAFSMLQPV
jgi:hypothetical protein